MNPNRSIPSVARLPHSVPRFTSLFSAKSLYVQRWTPSPLYSGYMIPLVTRSLRHASDQQGLKVYLKTGEL